MALFDDMFKGGGLPGLAVGIGAALLVPTVLPAVGRALRPMAKAVIKTGISVYREASTQMGNAMGGIVEEARGELSGRGSGGSGAA